MITYRLKQVISLCFSLIFLISALPSECTQHKNTPGPTNQINRMTKDILESHVIKQGPASVHKCKLFLFKWDGDETVYVLTPVSGQVLLGEHFSILYLPSI